MPIVLQQCCKKKTRKEPKSTLLQKVNPFPNLLSVKYVTEKNEIKNDDSTFHFKTFWRSL